MSYTKKEFEEDSFNEKMLDERTINILKEFFKQFHKVEKIPLYDKKDIIKANLSKEL